MAKREPSSLLLSWSKAGCAYRLVRRGSALEIHRLKRGLWEACEDEAAAISFEAVLAKVKTAAGIRPGFGEY